MMLICPPVRDISRGTPREYENGPSGSDPPPWWSSTGSSSPCRSMSEKDSMPPWLCCGCHDAFPRSVWRPPAGSLLAGPIRSPRYAHVQPILATSQDKTAELRPPREELVEHGGYVRGASYYAEGGAK